MQEADGALGCRRYYVTGLARNGTNIGTAFLAVYEEERPGWYEYAGV